MPNFQRWSYNAPLAFFIRPEGPGAQHSARVKLNANYNVASDRNVNFSVQFFPATAIASGHPTGTVRQADINAMVLWLDSNRKSIIDYYTGTITFRQLDAALAANPHP